MLRALRNSWKSIDNLLNVFEGLKVYTSVRKHLKENLIFRVTPNLLKSDVYHFQVLLSFIDLLLSIKSNLMRGKVVVFVGYQHLFALSSEPPQKQQIATGFSQILGNQLVKSHEIASQQNCWFFSNSRQSASQNCVWVISLI